MAYLFAYIPARNDGTTIQEDERWCYCGLPKGTHGHVNNSEKEEHNPFSYEAAAEEFEARFSE